MSDYAKQPRRKYCQFCKDEVQYVDYKDTQMLRKYVTDRGKIKPRWCWVQAPVTRRGLIFPRSVTYRCV